MANPENWLISLGVFVAAAALLAIERLCYAWVWNRPMQFRAVALRAGVADPVEALEKLFYCFKVLQIAVFAGWCLYFGATHGWAPPVAQPSTALAIALIGIGQVLNAAVFLRLGRVGVFYGNRFGRRVEWREGFPFSLIDHPQYVGTVLTIWGVFLLLRYPYPDWIVLPLLQTVYYVWGAWAEQRAPETVEAIGYRDPG